MKNTEKYLQLSQLYTIDISFFLIINKSKFL